MGLSFKKELTLADEQVYPPSKQMKSLGKTRLQERLVTKLGQNSFPFQLNFPRHCPTSVSLIPAADDTVRILKTTCCKKCHLSKICLQLSWTFFLYKTDSSAYYVVCFDFYTGIGGFDP